MKKTGRILFCLLLLGLCVFVAVYFAKRGADLPAAPESTAPAATGEITLTVEETTAPFPVQNVEVTLPISDAEIRFEKIETEDEALDETLSAMAEEIFRAYVPNAASLSASGAEIRYDAKLLQSCRRGRIYSAVFGGAYSVYDENGAGGAEGEIFYTVNIDTENMRLLALPDWIDVDAMYAAFADGKFTPCGEKTAADESLSQYPPEYGIYPYVYLDGDDFCLNITQSGVYEENIQYKLPLSAVDFILPDYLFGE